MQISVCHSVRLKLRLIPNFLCIARIGVEYEAAFAELQKKIVYGW